MNWKEAFGARVLGEEYRPWSTGEDLRAATQDENERAGPPAAATGSPAGRKRVSSKLALLPLGLLCAAGPALARAADMPAPTGRFELGLGLGYSQAFGSVGSGLPRQQDLGKAGGAFQLDAGLRIDPRWLVGAYGEFGIVDGGDAAGSQHAISVAAGVQAQLHLLPEQQIDPWVGLGFGWRGEWANFDSGTYQLQGLDLVRFRAGVDYRLSPQFSIGPVVGVTLTDFLKEKPVGADRTSDISGKKVNTFVFAGVGGRFDL